MSSLCAQQHADAFFRRGKHADLMRLVGGIPAARWEALADKAACKHLSHLTGETWMEAYTEILRRLRERTGRA